MKFCYAPVDVEIKSIINFKHVFKLYKEKFKESESFLNIMGLTENELLVLDMRFDDNGTVSLSRPKIASLIEVCSERVRQIEKKALFKLQQTSRSEKIKKFLK